MKQHVRYVTMLLAAVCGAAGQKVGASYSDCLSADSGALDIPAIRSTPMWPAQRIGSERARGGTASPGAHATGVPDPGDRYVTLDTACVAVWGESRPVYWDLCHDAGLAQKGVAVPRPPFELFGMTPFADGYGALSPCRSNSWRDRLDGVRFEASSGAVVVAEGLASLSGGSAPEGSAVPRASAMVLSCPGAVLLSAIGVVLVGQQRRKTLF